MANLKKFIISNIVSPEIKNKHISSTARVLSYNNKTNTATIEIQSSNTPDVYVRNNIQVNIANKSFKSNSLKPNDRVLLEFIGGNPSNPRIIGFDDNRYYSNTYSNNNHLEACCNTFYIPEMVENKKTLIDDLITEKFNKNIHYELLKIPIKEFMDDVTGSIGFYLEDDVGITNQLNNHFISIKDNGNILIATKKSSIMLNANGDIDIKCNNLNIDVNRINQTRRCD